jgi:hypothetical protein
MDRWLIWPAFASVGGVAVVTLICGLPGVVSFVLIPLSLLLYAIAALALSIAVVISAARRRPRRAGSLLLALIAPVLLWSPINWAAEYAHLGLTVALDSPDRSGFAVYDWSVGLVGGPNTFLIHDVTDEIARPAAPTAEAARSEGGFAEDCAGRVRHLLGHYYVCTL